MMNKKIIKLFCIIALIGAVCSIVAFASSGNSDVTLAGEKVEESYNYGSTLIIPQKQFIRGGDSFETSTTLIYPSGKKSTFNMVKLDEIGSYKLNYTAQIDGTEKVESFSFDAVVASSELWVDNHMILSTDEVVPTYSPSLNEKEDRSAVVISAYEKGYVNYKNNIYLGDNTLNDELISLLIVPDNVGVIDFQVLKIVLEDAKDPSNKLYIKLAAHAYNNNQADFELNKYRFNMIAMVSVDDVNYTKAEAPSVNYFKGTGFFGCMTTLDKPTAPVSIRYSEKENKLKLVSGAEEIVMNLYDESFMGKGLAFEGFSSSTVSLSLGFEKFKSSKPAKVAIYGVDGVLMGADITKSAKKPDILVDYKYFEDEQVIAKVGAKHRFLEVSVIDAFDKDLDVDVSVYYVEEDRTEKVLSENGYFVPDKVGEYLVEYTTQKNFVGLSGSVSYTLTVLPAEECAISFEFGQIADTVNVGDILVIPEHEASGGIGEKTVVYSAKVGTKSVSISNNRIFAEFAGEMVITATITDDAHDDKNPAVRTKTVTVIGTDKTFIDVGNIPSSIMAGDSIELNIEAYKFTDSGKTKQAHTVKFDNATLKGDTLKPTAGQTGIKELVIESGSEQKVISIKVVEPYNGANKSMLDFFSFDNATATLGDEYENISVEFDKDASVEFLRKIKTESFRLGFAVKGNGKTSANFEKIKITLTDAKDGENQIAFEISKGDESTSAYSKFTYNGKTGNIVGSFYDAFASDNGAFNIRYDQKTNALLDSKDTKLIDFNAVDGFDISNADEIYLKIELVGVSEKSTLRIKSLANQEFTDSVKKGKNAGPDIVIKSDDWSARVGEEFAFPECSVWDVFSEVSSITLSVKDSSDKEVYSANGTEGLKYEFTVVGAYTVSYTAKDSEGNTATVQKSISVIDPEDEDIMKVMGVKVFSSEVSAPSFKLANAPVESAKVGESFAIAKISVDDNGGKDKLRLYAYVIEPDGGRILLLCTPNKTVAGEKLTPEEKVAMFTDLSSDSITYTAEQKGKHLVYYLIIDETGLSTIAYYAVEVK